MKILLTIGFLMVISLLYTKAVKQKDALTDVLVWPLWWQKLKKRRMGCNRGVRTLLAHCLMELVLGTVRLNTVLLSVSWQKSTILHTWYVSTQFSMWFEWWKSYNLIKRILFAKLINNRDRLFGFLTTLSVHFYTVALPCFYCLFAWC